VRNSKIQIASAGFLNGVLIPDRASVREWLTKPALHFATDTDGGDKSLPTLSMRERATQKSDHFEIDMSCECFHFPIQSRTSTDLKKFKI
jgi:hypothetical protein